MAHLAVITGAGANKIAQSFGTQSQSLSTAGDAFAALIGAETQAIQPTARATSATRPATETTKADTNTDRQPNDIDPTLAPIETQPPVDPTPVVALIDMLGQLHADLEAGKPLNTELLTQIEDALSQLALDLGLDLDALTSGADLDALLAAAQGDAETPASVFAAMLAAITETQSSDTTPVDPNTAATARLDAISDKLTKLFATASQDGIDAEKLASLGFNPDDTMADEIEAAIARLAAKPLVPDEPELAAPSLKLTEPSLSGSASDAEETPLTKPVELSAASEKSAGDNANQQDRPNATLQRPTATAAAATAAELTITPQATPDASLSASPTQSATPAVDPTTLRTIAPVYLSSQQQLNIPQIAFELARQMEGGMSRFQIRLDPPELGRIDVRMDIDQSGQINARLTVEKPETLDMMQRDQRALEQALRQAGIDAGRANLEFSLKQNGHQADRDGFAGRNGAGAEDADEGDAPAPQVTLYRGSLQASGLNILA